jgi:hypothetical protein
MSAEWQPDRRSIFVERRHIVNHVHACGELSIEVIDSILELARLRRAHPTSREVFGRSEADHIIETNLRLLLGQYNPRPEVALQMLSQGRLEYLESKKRDRKQLRREEDKARAELELTQEGSMSSNAQKLLVAESLVALQAVLHVQGRFPEAAALGEDACNLQQQAYESAKSAEDARKAQEAEDVVHGGPLVPVKISKEEEASIKASRGEEEACCLCGLFSSVEKSLQQLLDELEKQLSIDLLRALGRIYTLSRKLVFRSDLLKAIPPLAAALNKLQQVRRTWLKKQMLATNIRLDKEHRDQLSNIDAAIGELNGWIRKYAVTRENPSRYKSRELMKVLPSWETPATQKNQLALPVAPAEERRPEKFTPFAQRHIL